MRLPLRESATVSAFYMESLRLMLFLCEKRKEGSSFFLLSERKRRGPRTAMGGVGCREEPIDRRGAEAGQVDLFSGASGLNQRTCQRVPWRANSPRAIRGQGAARETGRVFSHAPPQPPTGVVSPRHKPPTNTAKGNKPCRWDGPSQLIARLRIRTAASHSSLSAAAPRWMMDCRTDCFS